MYSCTFNVYVIKKVVMAGDSCYAFVSISIGKGIAAETKKSASNVIVLSIVVTAVCLITGSCAAVSRDTHPLTGPEDTSYHKENVDGGVVMQTSFTGGFQACLSTMPADTAG